MADYMGLIAELRKWQTLGDAPVGKGFGVLVDKLTLKQAADAIEQLIKERDAAVADIEEVIHEEFGDICTICTKYKSCMKIAAKTPLAQPPCERGKWRGLVGG